MYNLTVDTAHTFYVGEGQWLVHNACRPVDMRKIDWSDYPGHIVPKPKGPLQFLDGDNYDKARDLANWANDFLHKKFPGKYDGFDIHEIKPVKFGGSPVDVANKIPLKPSKHQVVSNWWLKLQRQIEKNPAHYLK
jgi:hypothetical protein